MKKTDSKQYTNLDRLQNSNNCEAIRGPQTNCTATVNAPKFEPVWKTNKAPQTYQRSKLQSKSCLRIENVVGNATKYFSEDEGSSCSPCSKDKEYVFVFIFNNENVSREKLSDNSKLFKHRSNSELGNLDPCDVSSAMSDENITLGNVTVGNVNFSTAGIKEVASKIMDKMLPTNKTKTTTNLADISAKYFLVLNQSIPVMIENCPESELCSSKAIDNVPIASKELICHSIETSQLQMSPEDFNLPVNNITQKIGDNSVNLDMDMKCSDSFVLTNIKYDRKVQINVKSCKEVKREKTKEINDINNMCYKSSPDGSFVCTKCNRKFKGLKSLKIHHSKNRCKGSEITYKCERCGTFFKTKLLRTKHMRTVCRLVAEKKRICEYCGREFNNNSALYWHVQSHKNARRHKCPECGKGFNKRYLCTIHIKNVHRKEKPWYYCARCGIKSLNKTHILAHEKTHDLPEGAEIPTPFKCFCGKGYISQYKLTIHQNFTHKPKKCSVCAEMLGSSYELMKHKEHSHGIVFPSVKKKPKNDSQSCPVCSKSFLSVQSLNDHLELIHNIFNPGKRKLKCSKCLKLFVRFASLIIHRRHDHNEEVLESELQAMSDALMASTSNGKSSLDNKSIHKKWNCDHCDKKFRLKGNLSNHIYNCHTSGCRTCSVCDLTFNSRKEFYAHKNSAHISSEERTCQICHKVFLNMKSLWGHKFVHTSTSHPCSECGSRFKRKGDYDRHVRDKHGVAKESAG